MLNERESLIPDGDPVGALLRQVRRVENGINSEEPIATLRALDTLNRTLILVSQDVIEEAYATGNYTKKQLADALGVPPSYLRELQKPVRA